MARKAARLERAGALTPRDMIWAAIRDLHADLACFSPVEICHLINRRRGEVAAAELTLSSVMNYIDGLLAAKPAYLERAAAAVYGRKHPELRVYALVRDVGVDAPRVTRDGRPVTQGAGNEAMWLAMKTLKDFDCRELAAAASAGAVKVGLNSARMYCTWLTHAEYLVVTHKGTGHQGNRYRFMRSRDTGPRAPLVTGEHEVIDANTAQVFYQGRKGCQAKT